MTPRLLAALAATAAAAPTAADPPPEVAAALHGLVTAPELPLTGGILDQDRAWLRAGPTCVRVDLDRAEAAPALVWTTCEAEPFTCRWRRSLEPVWGHASSHACQRTDGTGWGGGSGGSAHDLPVLVRHDDDAAEWGYVFTMRADLRVHRRARQPCTPETAAHGSPSPSGPVRECDTSEGVALQRINPYGRMGIGVGVASSTVPVDCTVPCPENPDLERVRTANAWLDGRRFTEAGGERIGLYATEAACRAAPGPSTDWLPTHLCDDPEAPAER